MWVKSGFSVPPKPSIASQVDHIRDDLRAKGYTVTYRQLALHPSETPHLFIVSERRREKSSDASDQVLLYDSEHGILERKLDFRPRITLPDAGVVTASAFSLMSVHDIDGNGHKELVGSWDTNQAGLEYQRVPVIVSRGSEGLYNVTPLMTRASLDDSPTNGLATYGFAPPRRGPAATVWVSDLSLDTKRAFLPREGTLITSVVARGAEDTFAVTVVPADAFGRRVPGIPRVIRFWTLDLSGAAPRTRALCLLNPPTRPIPRLPVRGIHFGNASYLTQPLASAMRAAGLALGDWHDGG